MGSNARAGSTPVSGTKAVVDNLHDGFLFEKGEDGGEALHHSSRNGLIEISKEDFYDDSGK